MSYRPDPTANEDTYVVRADQAAVAAPGVLANDTSSTGAPLAAAWSGGETGVSLSSNGGFTCASAPGRYTFTYVVNDTQANSAPATVNLVVAATNAWYDDFTRTPTDGDPLAGWRMPPSSETLAGDWTVANGKLEGAAEWNKYAIIYTNGLWTNYSVEARIRFQPGAGGGGVGARVDSASGARYAAWIYPEESPGGSNVLRLIKFTGWSGWPGTALMTTNLMAVGTNWHTLKLSVNADLIEVYFDDMTNRVAWASDSAYVSGGVSMDLYNWTIGGVGLSYNMSVDDVVVSPP